MALYHMTCGFQDCEARGRWIPVLSLRRSKNEQPLEAALPELRRCEFHKQESTLENFLTDDGWKKIKKHLRQLGRGTYLPHLTALTWKEDRLVITPSAPEEKEGLLF